MKTVKVLIIDDSKLVQDMLTKFMESDSVIKVVGCAQDAYEARDFIKKLNPDVLTLDIMMPGMDGITFLKNLMRLHPMPVVMVSALTKQHSEIALEALASGAVDYIEKPSSYDLRNPDKYAARLNKIVKEAAKSDYKMRSLKHEDQVSLDSNIMISSDLLRDEIIAMGASTGGIEAIEYLLSQFPKVFPPVLITQHIRKDFSTVFLNRLSRICRSTIKQAADYEKVFPGFVYLAVPGAHLTLQRNQLGYFCYLDHSPRINNHRPSVDVLFNSVAKVAGKNSIGILLTGMGVDGAKGLKMIKDTGGSTIAQDQESSVVWGMPGAAVKLGAVDHVVPLESIVAKILNILDGKARERAFNA